MSLNKSTVSILAVSTALSVGPAPVPALGQCEQVKLTASNPAAEDRFGWWVSVSGDRTIVGVPGDDDACLDDPDCDTGSAFVYKREGSTWIEEAKLTAPDPSAGQSVGNRVSLSGTVAALGAREAVYVYRWDSTAWVMEQKLIPSGGPAGENFGSSVFVSGDLLAVGASGTNCADGSIVCGAAYVYRYNGTAWVEEVSLLGSDTSSRDAFGISVATDGSRVVVGAWGDDDACPFDILCNSGSAYVFRHDGATWGQEAKLIALDSALGDRFGFSVSISGDRIIVGSMYDDDACPGNPACNSGAGYVYRYDGMSWVEEGKLTASDAASWDQFGQSVVLADDVALVGGGGSAYLFKHDGDAWIEITKLTPSDSAGGFGWSVFIGGDYAVIGAPSTDVAAPWSGSAYVFRVLGEPDTNSNGINDYCESDCNGNGIPDDLDIAAGTSNDCNANGVPDECEPDCNGNGIADSCDIAGGTSQDCTGNGIPDECEPDCNGNSVADSCDIAAGTSDDCTGNEIPDECEPDCNGNSLADSCDIASGTSQDCNGNGVPDECDLLAGNSQDCTGNGVPDECEPDCNFNGTADSCDILKGTSQDIDENGIPDECENWSLCQTGEGFFDFTPHRSNPEAEQLAMTISGQLRAPDEEYNRILRDLQLIRDAYTVLVSVVDTPDYSPDQLIVRLVDGAPLEAFDGLNAFFQVIEERVLSASLQIHLLTFCDNLNAPVLAPEYAALPEVLYAEPNWMIGGDDEITVTQLGTIYRYRIVHGFNDCFDGCDCEQVWVIDVDESGTVTLISYEENQWFGDCFSDFVSCCLLTGRCTRTTAAVCLEQGGASVPACLGDGNLDGSDDACTACLASSPAQPEIILDVQGNPVISQKNRFCSFTAGDAGRSQAIRIRFVDLPAPYSVLNGTLMWVSEPQEVSENSGEVQPIPGFDTFQAATLQCVPFYTDWSGLGTVHVFHEGIVPGGVYELQAIDSGCSTTVEGSFSVPLALTMAKWGDTVENCTVSPCLPPDGVTNILDVLAIVDKFVNAPGAIIKARADLQPATPDRIIDILDVLRGVDAFIGLPYPFPVPADPCP